MRLRKRGYDLDMVEITGSGVVPGIIEPLGVIKRATPGALLMRIIGKEKPRRKKRLIKRASKEFSPPLPPRI